MIEVRNDYGFPFDSAADLITALNSSSGASMVGLLIYPAPMPTKLERAQAYAAEVRARRGMVVRKGFYVDLKP